MRILVLGVLGMAGHVMAEVLKNAGHEVVGFARRESPYCKTIIGDAQDGNLIREVLSNGAFDAVINCIGVLNKEVDANPAEGIYLNSVLPHLLVKYTAGTGTKVIHLSTDCVFSGKDGNYREDSFRDADSMYGRSKTMGELNDEKNLTIRTSIVGPDLHEKGCGLFNWFMKQNGTVNGYTQAIWSGVTTIELAKAVATVLESDVTGLYHLVNGDKIDKCSLLRLFNEMRVDPVVINPVNNDRVDKSIICTRTDFKYTVPSYEEMVQEMERWIRNHSDMYNRYCVRTCGN